MKIDIILPFREQFTLSKASAVSTSVKNSIIYSSYKNNIKIYGQHVNKPILENNFIGIKTNKFIHFSNNVSLVKNYLKLNTNDNEKKIIEIHNRPYLLKYLFKQIKSNPIIIYFHNDPIKMKGSKTVKEREEILQNATAIVFVSDFLKERFLEGLSYTSSKLFVIPNSLNINKKSMLPKSNKVLFVGRLVKEKGIEIYVDAISKIAKNYPDWEFILIGNSGSRNRFFKNNYDKEIIKKFKSIAPNTNYLGFLSNKEVLKTMQISSVLVVPSLWEEPFGLTAIEGLSNRMLVIGNNVGGLKDIIFNRGVLINNINKDKLLLKLIELLNNPDLILNIQKKCWETYIYDQDKVSYQQDQMRNNIFNKFFE